MKGYRSSKFGTLISGLVGVAVLIAIVYALTAVQPSSDHGLDTQARTAPEGAVIPAGGGRAVPTGTANVDEGPGVAVYHKACITCHGTGVANAPKLGDRTVWEPRMAQGIGRLLQTVIAGKGAMPPRGACADCLDDDLQAAIEYMLVQVGYEPVFQLSGGSYQLSVGKPAPDD